MDIRISKLIVTLAIGLTIVVSTMAYFGFRNAGGGLFDRDYSSEPADDRHPQYERRYVRASRDAVMRDEIRSIKRLRELVDTKGRQLQARTGELRRATLQQESLKEELQELRRQHDRLRRESDQSMSMLAELSAQVNDVGPGATALAQDGADPANDESAGDAALDVEIDLIEWQIEQANQRIAELELTAMREIIRSNEATQALVATGASAVPILIDRLADEDPDIRQWAAAVLGQIGPDASLAVEALLQTLNDENEEVRDSARVALDRIENRS